MGQGRWGAGLKQAQPRECAGQAWRHDHVVAAQRAAVQERPVGLGCELQAGVSCYFSKQIFELKR